MQRDLLFLRHGWHYEVYIVKISSKDKDESNCYTLMIGSHYIVAEMAARNLEILVKILGYNGFTNDLVEQTIKYF
jgi:hypothetical protein